MSQGGPNAPLLEALGTTGLSGGLRANEGACRLIG